MLTALRGAPPNLFVSTHTDTPIIKSARLIYRSTHIAKEKRRLWGPHQHTETQYTNTVESSHALTLGSPPPCCHFDL